MDPDKRSAWLQKLDAECPYQVVLPRRQLTDDSEIVNFLLSYVGKFDMYVEDECAAYVRYCFKDPMDVAIFRSRFERKSDEGPRIFTQSKVGKFCTSTENGGFSFPS